MSNEAFNKVHTGAAGAHQASNTAFDRVLQNEEPDVHGHLLESSDAAVQASAHASVFKSDAEVEGHQQEQSPESVEAAGGENEAAEVEGHIHPLMMDDYARGRAADIEAGMSRAAQVHEARTGSRDGGLVAKVLRRKAK